LQQTIDFLKQCTINYPNEPFFYRLGGCLCGFSKEYKKGLNELNKAMKLKPNYYEILYERAAMMRLVEECDYKDILEAYQSFLKTAPKDHRKIPETYYAMAFCLLDKNCCIKMKAKGKYNFSEELISKMRSYYEKELKAEKIQMQINKTYKKTVLNIKCTAHQ
jgi:tetratricopeptide (TPR) repeat protein